MLSEGMENENTKKTSRTYLNGREAFFTCLQYWKSILQYTFWDYQQNNKNSENLKLLFDREKYRPNLSLSFISCLKWEEKKDKNIFSRSRFFLLLKVHDFSKSFNNNLEWHLPQLERKLVLSYQFDSVPVEFSLK